MTCPALSVVAAWVLGELPGAEAERFEEHYFGCEGCFRRAAGMQRLVAQLRAALPPILTLARRRELTARQPLPAVDVRPGERAKLRLGPSTEVGIWVMHAALDQVTRVDFEARRPDGGLVFALTDVPFDAERGEVVLACQVHYSVLPGPPVLHVQLTATGPDGQRPVGLYVLDHEFENL